MVARLAKLVYKLALGVFGASQSWQQLAVTRLISSFIADRFYIVPRIAYFIMTMATGADTAGPSGITQEQFQELLTSLRRVRSDTAAVIDEKMSQLKHELVEEQETANTQVAKKLRLDKTPFFKKKSNEKQFVHHAKVSDKLTEAESALERMPPEVEKAKTALQEGEKLIVERQKLLRIADCSEHGWATAEEYQEDELADNSDDEKRLFHAEQRAGRKLKANKTKKKWVHYPDSADKKISS